MLIAVLLPWLGLGVTDGFSGALRAAVRHTLSISKHCVTGEQPKLGGSGSVGLLGSTTLTFHQPYLSSSQQESVKPISGKAC